jgi:hypothetical protein
MNARNYRIAKLVAEFGFRDPARPVEWLTILALTGWVQFLIQSPEVFTLPRYEAFAAMPPSLWAAIMAGVIVAQLVGMLPVRGADRIRFIAMALTTGIWVVIAFSFWSSVSAPIAARTASAIAFAAAMTGVYLGWVSQKS